MPYPAAEALCCANIRGGASFAVASAYERSADVDEKDAVALFRRVTSGDAETRRKER